MPDMNTCDGRMYRTRDPEASPFLALVSDYLNEFEHFLLSGIRTQNNDFDIYVSDLTCERKLSWDTSGNDILLNAISAVNSIYDDAYPTIGPDNSDYFCSNSNGNFDIFAATIISDPYKDLNGFRDELTDTSKNIELASVGVLNSFNDDKCPYIVDSTMLFISNRSGSIEGFDI